jgi:hypothetical protein
VVAALPSERSYASRTPKNGQEDHLKNDFDGYSHWHVAPYIVTEDRLGEELDQLRLEGNHRYQQHKVNV